ncbi:MAG: ATP synthase F1 subunit delta [Lachnospiraceae bacterium]|nr:ATP synthase F1 subunit delta [Lachnospiraceae bacterium]
MAKLISKTYGEALFELAVEEGKVDVFLEEISELLKILKTEEEFTKMMNHPKILKEDKIKVVENVFKGRISDEIVGFLTLIIQKDRYSEAEAILEYFLNQVKEYKGIGVAYVKTAVALTDIQKKQIEERLLNTTKYRQMEMHFSVDKALIGGMVIRIGDRVVDSSISTKLGELERQLMKIQLG